MKELEFVQLQKGNKELFDLAKEVWLPFIREVNANDGKKETEDEIIDGLKKRVNIQGSRKDMHFEIVLRGSEVIGISMFAVDLGTIYGLLDGPGYGTVMGFYIKPEHRRCGYGRLFFKHIEEKLKEDGATKMYVCPDPVTGEPFWKAMGFYDSGKYDPDDKKPIFIKNITENVKKGNDMATYYIDPLIGSAENDGLSETSPLDTHENLALRAGDTVLFRRGTEYRRGIHHKGIDGAPVTFGAYGNGDAPKFYGSINRSEPYLWQKTERENVWKLAIPLKDEPCNVIFDFGDHCGTLAWTIDGLDSQGKWYSDAIGKRVKKISFDSADFYLYSTENPGKYYSDIEIAKYGERMILSADKNAVFEGLCVSCAGVHGFAATRPENVVIRDCRFEFIGGCVWDLDRKIRFGNGAEYWDGGKNVTVEDCVFYQIFDSCFTTQGSENMSVHENIRCAGNTMSKYGMAAFELRDRIGKNVVFELNVCEGAGHGFALNGEPLPRYSEIYPEPMGHHVFIWRGKPTDGGHVEIRRNVFRGRPTGERVYIRADSTDAARQVNIENNEIQ